MYQTRNKPLFFAPSVSSISSLDIPQEIVDLVVDAVASDDTQNHDEILADLRVCALISRSFHISSYRLLFRQLEIVYDSDQATVESRMKRLHQVFEDNPILVSYISSLKISIRPRTPANEPSQPFWKRFLNKSYYQKSNTSRVLQWLASEARLTSLEIIGPAIWKKLSSFDKDLASILILIAQSHPHLRSLNISDTFYVPTSILARRSQVDPLNHLTLSDCGFLLSDPPILQLTPGTTKPPLDLTNLESLVIRRPYFPLQIFDHSSEAMLDDAKITGTSALHFPKLKFLSFALGCSILEFIILGRLLKSNAPSWKRLRIEVETFNLFVESFAVKATNPPAEVHKLVPLKELLIFSDMKTLHTPRTSDIGTTLQMISKFLRCLMLPTTIESLAIDVSLTVGIVSDMGGNTELLSKFAPGLVSVEDVLCDDRRFPHLKNVDICLTVHGEDGNWCDDLCNAISPRLGLTSRVSVNINARICHVKY